MHDSITRAASILSRGSEGIDAVLNEESPQNRCVHALEALEQLANNEHMPIAIVGGLAAIHYGYPAATQGIDIAIAQKDLATLISCSRSYGFKVEWESKLGWHTLIHGDVEINVVPEGGSARDSSPTTIPGPVELGVTSGLDYASIERWIELKVSSGRRKDQAHIVEVLKTCSAEIIEVISGYLGTCHDDYADTFSELLDVAQAERDQENKRR